MTAGSSGRHRALQRERASSGFGMDRPTVCGTHRQRVGWGRAETPKQFLGRSVEERLTSSGSQG